MSKSSDYHFITHWCLPATIEEVSTILSDAEDLARWWPSVYLRVEEVEPGNENGVGKVVKLHTKGWLSNAPHGFALEAWGDFIGRGIWTFVQDGDHANVTYD